MIKVRKLSKHYKKNDNIIYAIDNINLEFEYGKLYAIIGESGSGKSTLLYQLGLLDQPSYGKISFDNIIINSETKESEKTTIRRRKIGFVFQDFYLDANLKAYENVMLPMYLDKKKSKKNMKENSIKILEYFGLENRIHHYPKEMSGGEQQRVAIARAIANNPKIILADEPTGNLDKKNEESIFNFLKKISEFGCCVIIATHSDTIKKYTNNIITLKNGRVVHNEKC